MGASVTRGWGRVAAVVCLVTIASGAVHAQEESGWPFGGKSMEAKDYFPLGLLGGKARDPERMAPTVVDEGNGRSRVPMSDIPKIISPNSLRIELLYPGGPLEKARVRVGDVIVGAPEPFTDGCLVPLSEALIAAEGGDGRVELLIERDGEREQVRVKIDRNGKSALDPSSDDHRTYVLEEAADWLAETQLPEGGFWVGSGGSIGDPIVGTLAGLVWLAHGSDTRRGEYRKNVAGVVTRLQAEVDEIDRQGVRGPDQTHWLYAYGALFLGELHARRSDDDVRELLFLCAQRLCDGQAESGGWGHGPGGPNPLGYVELNILTGMALTGIGLAEQAGFEVPPTVLTRADDFLKASSSEEGGVGYSPRRGQQGHGNIGRNVVNWLGYRALGIDHSPFGKRMAAWASEHAGDYEQGHASLMQHIQFAGIFAHTLNDKTREAFWRTARRDLTLARAPDGSLHPRPFRETIGNDRNGDASKGLAWTTACWALAIAADPGDDRDGLPALRGEHVERKRSITGE